MVTITSLKATTAKTFVVSPSFSFQNPDAIANHRRVCSFSPAPLFSKLSLHRKTNVSGKTNVAARTSKDDGVGLTYKDAGVDIDAGSELVRRIAKMALGIGGLFPLGMTFLLSSFYLSLNFVECDSVN